MKYCVVILVCMMTLDLSSGLTYNIDMEQASSCTKLLPIEITLFDIANLYAAPPMTVSSDRDECIVKFKAPDGGYFKIYVQDLVFGECNVNVKIYEDMFLNTAKYTFGCKDGAGGLYYTSSSEIAVALEKPSSRSNRYKFYIRVAQEKGPDIGGKPGGESDIETEALGPGAIAGIVVAVIIGVGIGVAILVYCIIVWRRKEEEKEVARSMSVLFPTTAKSETDHRDGGSSVHSSVHSSAHISWHSNKLPSDNPAYNYPAYRTKMSISDKKPECNSIDTKSYDSENTANESTEATKPKVKSVRKEMDSLRRTIFRIERDKEREKEEELRYLERERDRGHHYNGHHDEPLIDRRDRGLTSGRHTSNRPVLNAENIKSSLRNARDKGRSFGSDGNRATRNGSVRSGRSGHSSRSKHKGRSHSPARSADYLSERHEHRSRRDRHDDRDRSRSGHRSSSAHSRRTREYHDDRDYYSDHDTRHDRRTSRGRDAYSEDDSDDDRYDDRNRSRGHRARSGSAGRRRR